MANTLHILDTTGQTKQFTPPYDAIVGAKGDYPDISSALAAGHTTLFVKDGVYTETADLTLPNNATIVGESMVGTVINFSGAFSLKCDGSGGTKETAGTIAFTNGSTAVVGTGTTFTNLNPVGDDTYILLGADFFKVASVTDNTNIVLANAFRGRTLGGQAYCAQKMKTGIKIACLTVANSSSDGIYARAVSGLAIEGVVLDSNNRNAVMEDCSACFLSSISANNSVGDCVEINNCYSVELLGIKICNSGAFGIDIIGASSGIVLNGCLVFASQNDGINLNGTTNNVNITDCVIKNNQVKGIDSGTTTDSVNVTTCNIIGNTEDGVDYDGTRNQVNGCIIIENGILGIKAGLKGNLTGNYIASNGSHGIQLTNDDDTVVASNVICDNGGDGINCPADDCVLVGNRIFGNAGNGIEVTATANDTIVDANNLKGNTGTNFVDSGTGTMGGASENKT